MQNRDYQKAFKYAVAFLDVYPESRDFKASIKKYNAFYLFLTQNEHALPIISLSGIKKEASLACIEKIRELFDFNPMECSFIAFFLKKKNEALLPIVFKQIVMLLYERNGLVFCTIETSHSISQNDKDQLIKFFSEKMGKQVVANFYVNEKLIFGVKLKSNFFSWEKTISSRLRTMTHMFSRKGAACLKTQI
jgi:F0F1-type ATP synthase delta subunit